MPDTPDHPPTATAVADGWLRPSLLTLSALLLGLALNINEGMYAPWAIGLLIPALLACVAAVAPPSPTPTRRWQRILPTALLVFGVLVQLYVLFYSRPGTWKNVNWSDPPNAVGPLSMTGKLRWPSVVRELRAEQSALLREIQGKPDSETGTQRHRVNAIQAHLNVTKLQIGFVAMGLLALAAIPVRSRGFAMPLFLVAFFSTGVYALRAHPDPHIDVFVFQQHASQALLDGRNPYSLDFPNIYGPGNYVYAPGLERDDRVNFGFPYPPAPLLMALPGYALANDHRYAQLLSLTLAGALLAYCRQGLLPKLAAILLLTTPRIIMTVECAWTEPFTVVALAATVFSACRFPRAMPYLLGLLLATKQYTIFIVPLIPLLLPCPLRWKELLLVLLKAAAVAAVISLPLILWDLKAFWWSAGTLQFKQPFRADSLAVPAWVANLGHPDLATTLATLAFFAVVPAIALALFRLPRTPLSFAAGIALTYFAFFAMNKQAFCNYYVFVLGALCAAIAATVTEPSKTEPVTAP